MTLHFKNEKPALNDLDTIQPKELFRTPDLYLGPVCYAITFQMLVTKWWWFQDGTNQGMVTIVFSGCNTLRVSWKGSQGPYDINFRQSSDGMLEFGNKTNEFFVRCSRVESIRKDQVTTFLKNLRLIGF